MSGSAEFPDLTRLPGVADAVELVRAAVGDLRRHPANRRGWPRSAAAAAVRAARASAALDGGSQVIDSDAETITDPVLAGALRANAGVAELAGVWERAPLQALARLHMLAAADLPGMPELGRPRDGAVVSTGVPVDQVAPRLAGVARAVTGSGWPGPVLAAIVHGEVLTIQPFGSADGVVARAASRLTMMASGLDLQGLTVPEVSSVRHPGRYRERAGGYSSGGPEGLRDWILYVCDCLIDGAREGRSIADAAGTD